MTQLSIGVHTPGQHFSIDSKSSGEVSTDINRLENQGGREKQLTGKLFH